jgi:DNA-binding transcriptional regulator YhcF (GntR family)
MFVSPRAREALRAERRKTFFTAVVDPMVAEAKAIGIPIADVLGRITKVMDEDEKR